MKYTTKKQFEIIDELYKYFIDTDAIKYFIHSPSILEQNDFIKNEYYLHPKAFKICLMKSLKTRKYADYYLLLEECVNENLQRYKNIQNMKKEKIIEKK